MNNDEEFNIIDKVLCMIPILFILTMLILHLTLPKKTFSIEEKRYLIQWPTFHVEEVLNGTYGTKVESYFSDQFPFRDFWVKIQEDTNQILFRN
ncbi:DHHW family protein [Tissierella praeacuta]|uniref:DHHW family protein n=1 Tax=Tissierella praeacuta TaxID=43131 RepID=UPI003342BE39